MSEKERESYRIQIQIKLYTFLRCFWYKCFLKHLMLTTSCGHTRVFVSHEVRKRCVARDRNKSDMASTLCVIFNLIAFSMCCFFSFSLFCASQIHIYVDTSHIHNFGGGFLFNSPSWECRLHKFIIWWKFSFLLDFYKLID